MGNRSHHLHKFTSSNCPVLKKGNPKCHLIVIRHSCFMLSLKRGPTASATGVGYGFVNNIGFSAIPSPKIYRFLDLHQQNCNGSFSARLQRPLIACPTIKRNKFILLKPIVKIIKHKKENLIEN